MKFLLRQLKALIRESVDAITVPAPLSPDEKEIADKFPKWNAPSHRDPLWAQSPVIIKTKQITKILHQSGYANTPEGAKKITQELPQFLRSIDPSDLLVSTAANLADAFINQNF